MGICTATICEREKSNGLLTVTYLCSLDSSALLYSYYYTQYISWLHNEYEWLFETYGALNNFLSADQIIRIVIACAPALVEREVGRFGAAARRVDWFLKWLLIWHFVVISIKASLSSIEAVKSMFPTLCFFSLWKKWVKM